MIRSSLLNHVGVRVTLIMYSLHSPDILKGNIILTLKQPLSSLSHYIKETYFIG